MEEYYENLDKFKQKRNYKSILVGIILAIIGYLVLIINDLEILNYENFLITIISLIIIHLSPIFLSNLCKHLINRDVGKIGTAVKPFILIELILIVISFNLLWFL